MKPFYWAVAGLAVLAGACSPAGSSAGVPVAPAQATPVVSASLPDLGVAPEIKNAIWLNTPQPLRLADLRGQVVLLNMWTFACINCEHVLPYIRGWYDTYHAQGLQVIGNHFPEFQYEADFKNLTDAVQRLDVHYPVAQDNDGQTWRAYDTHYWPTIFLIDKRGHLRYQTIGEGAYSQTEAAIQALLAENYP